MEMAKSFFVEQGVDVIETFVERGYTPDEEVQKHIENCCLSFTVLANSHCWRTQNENKNTGYRLHRSLF